MSVRLALALAFVLAAGASAQVDYQLSFEPGGKEWNVEARFPGRGEETLDFWIPLWTPGAYHVADYARFVRDLAASDERGTALSVARPDPSHFVVSGAAKAREIVLRYRADSMSSGTFTNNVIDVESNRIAADYAYVNPVSLFGFAPARAKEAITLTIAVPAGWKTATVLQKDAKGRYTAPSYYRLEDSPFLFSPTLETVEFQVDEKPHAVSVHGRNAADAEMIAKGCERIVEAGSRLMQGLPYDRYHFLFGFVGDAGGSGLEHSFSTLILVGSEMPVDAGSGPTDELSASEPFWGIVSHEFFHLWCAERIHVQAIHEPDLTQPLETGTIWVNEGITEYFSRHLLLHAGFLSEDQLLATYVANPLPAGITGNRSWTDVSRAASDWNGMTDIMQFAVRMYLMGPSAIFALDLEMRRASGGERGVLDLLHTLRWAYVEADRGFGEDELPAILSGVAQADMGGFYRRFIDGPEVPDLAQYLDVIGYGLRDGKAVALDQASEEQLAARRDYFSRGRP